MAFVRKRHGRKTPTIRFWDPATGKRREVSAESPEAKAIRAKRGEIERKLARNEPIDTTVNKITFDDGVKLILADYKLRERRSLDDLTDTIENHLRPYFGGMLLARITNDVLNAYLTERKDGTTEPTREKQVQRPAGLGTLRKELAAIRRIFRLAHAAGKLSTLPVFPTVAKPKPRKGFFEPHQLDAIKTELREQVLRDLLDLYCACGWRKRNLLQLQWSNVNRFTGTITVDTGETKTGEPLSFPYASDAKLKAIIERRWREKEQADARLERPVSWVFFRYAQAKPIKDFYNALRAAQQRAYKTTGDPEILKRIIHDFRRTAVRRFNRAKQNERTIMDITGHKTREVFLAYNITNEQDKRDAVAAAAREASREERHRKATADVVDMAVGGTRGGQRGGQS